jgi:hypothetical protein
LRGKELERWKEVGNGITKEARNLVTNEADRAEAGSVSSFQNGKNPPTPPVFSKWQTKEISRGNVPVWRYDQGGQEHGREKELRTRRGFMAATTGGRIAHLTEVVKCFAVNGRNWGLKGCGSRVNGGVVFRMR